MAYDSKIQNDNKNLAIGSSDTWFPFTFGWTSILILWATIISLVFYFYEIDSTSPWVILPIVLFIISWRMWNYLSNARTLLLRFIYPIILALLTMVLGTIGFKKAFETTPLPEDELTSYKIGDDLGNAIFAAANLITLNASVFSDDFIKSKTNSALILARIFGGLLASYAFILAFSLAAGRENMDRLYFWTFRNFPNRKKLSDFNVVIGNGEMAIKLAINLDKKNERVVFFDNGLNNKIYDFIKNRNIWYFKGHVTYKQDLLKTYFWLADHVYVLGNDDEENFRITQELDEIYKEESLTKPYSELWYIHLRDRRKRDMIQKFTTHSLNIFSIEQNTSRRLLDKHPFDHQLSNQQKNVQIVLLGFNHLAQELALTCLKQGHLERGKTLSIKVYYNEEEEKLVDHFKNVFPVLFKGTPPFGIADSAAKKIQQYTFFEDQETIITFFKLPKSETHLCQADWQLYQDISAGNIINIYACLDSGIESTMVLGSILPRLKWQQESFVPQNNKPNIKVFCHYNFPDEEEEAFIEDKLKEMADPIPISFFGNELKECTEDAIKEYRLDRLSKEIAMLYDVLFDPDFAPLKANRPPFDNLDKTSKIESVKQYIVNLNQMNKVATKRYHQELEKCWGGLSEGHRESNRQAADHAKIKLQILNRLPNAPDIINVKTMKADDLKLHLDLLYEKLSNSIPEVEHRRWSAFNLIDGFLPLPKDLHPLWKTNKHQFQDMKVHRDLRPFDVLTEGDKDKDYSAVLGAIAFWMMEQSERGNV